MKLLYALIFILIVFEGVGFSQTRATTEDGRTVILQKDGTWQLANVSKVPPAATKGTYQKPEKATQGFRPKDDPVVAWFDPQIWKRQQSIDEPPNKFGFIDRSGDVMGIVIVEGFAMSIDSLQNTIIETARNYASDFKVALEENRVVNGKKVLCMRIEETVQGIPVVAYGYYYAGKSSIVQLTTVSPQNRFSKYEVEMTEFLNGLVIND